jgi:hypothetical protein
MADILSALSLFVKHDIGCETAVRRMMRVQSKTISTESR